MSQPYPFSYSSLTSFETCPRRHYLTKVSKEVVEPQTEYLAWGNKVHGALENRVKLKTPLPEGMQQWEKYAGKFDTTKGTVYTETRYTLTRNLTPTDWTAKDAWVRGVIDLHVDRGYKVAAWDWKTGKVRPDSDQLKLFAGLLMQAKPYVEKVLTGFIWLNHDKVTKQVFTRGDLPDIWEDFIARSRRLEAAFNYNKWVPKSSGLCKAHCPVPNRLCEFSGRT